MSFYGQNFLDDFNMDTDYSNVDYTSPFLPSYTPPTVGPLITPPAEEEAIPSYSDIMRGLTPNYTRDFLPTSGLSLPQTTQTTTRRGSGGLGVTNKTPSIPVAKPDNSVPKYNEARELTPEWARYYYDELNIFGGAPLPGQNFDLNFYKLFNH